MTGGGKEEMRRILERDEEVKERGEERKRRKSIVYNSNIRYSSII